MDEYKAHIESIFTNGFQTVIFSGDVPLLLDHVVSTLQNLVQVDPKNHADIKIFQDETLPIDTVRDLKEWVYAMPQYIPSKTLVIAVQTISFVSQNALLKTLEEPSGHTRIVLLVPHTSILLPTVLSRSQVYSFSKPFIQNGYMEFLQAPAYERLQLPLAQNLLKTGEQKASKEEVMGFFEGLVQATIRAGYSKEERKKALATLALVTTYLSDQSPSIKMLVEYTSLQLPVLK